MHIENNSAYTPPLYTWATGKAANEDADQTSTTAPSKSQETTADNTAKAAAVTGVTGSNLSKEMVDQLMKAAQETGAPNTDTGKYDGPLFIGERHNLEDIASNPEYAEKRAEELGTYPDGVFFSAKEWPFPTPENPNKPAPSESEISAFRAKTGARMAEAEQIHQKRTAYYESLKAQGLPSAEIYANLLEFNANLPEDYNNTVGFSLNSPNQTWSEYHSTSHDYLQNLIDQGNAATASVKTADSTKAAQETSTSSANTEKYYGTLSDVQRRYLEDIANDPALAAREASLFGKAQRGMVFDFGTDRNNGPMSESEKRDSLKNGIFLVPPETGPTPMMALQDRASASMNSLYKHEQSEGVAPAQIYADIMKLLANQTDFNTIQDKNLNLPEGQTAQWHQASHDYLQNLINQRGAATTSVKTADSTKAAG